MSWLDLIGLGFCLLGLAIALPAALIMAKEPRDEIRFAKGYIPRLALQWAGASIAIGVVLAFGRRLVEIFDAF